jgi:Holliday junction DNA helicase RuvA
VLFRVYFAKISFTKNKIGINHMISSLKGIIEEINETSCTIDVGGVGYLVFLSSKNLQKLSVGEAAKLLIETWVREDAITLYGFLTSAERDCFNLLTSKVSGVGARMGMSILSTFTPAEIFSAIASRDKTMLTKATGVGAKLAERIVTELKDKVGTFNIGAQKVSMGEDKNSTVDDVVSALVNLGYRRADAFSVVWDVYNQSSEKDTQTLLKKALKELSSS